MQSAVQIVAKELDERLEALKHMPQGAGDEPPIRQDPRYDLSAHHGCDPRRADGFPRAATTRR